MARTSPRRITIPRISEPRAQRHPQPDLARPAGHRKRQQAVQADAREKERHGGEAREQRTWARRGAVSASTISVSRRTSAIGSCGSARAMMARTALVKVSGGTDALIPGSSARSR